MEGGVSVVSVFSHTHNAVEVAWQEREFAIQDYREAIRTFDARKPVAVAKLEAATERKNAAWDAWWVLTRGY
jgi:hypothetical protein